MKWILYPILLVLMSAPVSANLMIGANYIYLFGENETEGDKVSAYSNVLSSSIHYKFRLGEAFYISPGLSYGLKIGSGSVEAGSMDGDLDINSLMQAHLKVEYFPSDKWSIYVEPTYAEMNYKVSLYDSTEDRNIQSRDIDESYFSSTLGFSYLINNKVSLGVSAGVFKKVNVIQIGGDFRF